MFKTRLRSQINRADRIKESYTGVVIDVLNIY